MTLIIVDVESDGPLLGENSMVCFGAVVFDIEGKFDKTFYGQTSPISEIYNPESLAISGFTREEHKGFQDPSKTMKDFEEWLKQFNKPTLVSDNNGYDASWINYYMHKFTGGNPFGWTSRRIGDMFCGFYKDGFYKWKRHRDSEKYPHNHNPLSDCKSNASALLYLINQGFRIK